MINKEMLEWIKAHKSLAKLDFDMAIEYDDEDVKYVEDDDKCKIGYVTGYIDALDMLIRNLEHAELAK